MNRLHKIGLAIGTAAGGLSALAHAIAPLGAVLGPKVATASGVLGMIALGLAEISKAFPKAPPQL